jgi:hypothetical protein
MATQAKQHEAHVKLGTDERTIPAGPTVVRTLKEELGVDPAAVLYLVHGKDRQPLGNEETVDVKSGLHFEAIGGGGVS